MSLQTIINQALQEGYLTPVMETKISRICEVTKELSEQEYEALDELMSALLDGRVVKTYRKQFINVMEELVLNQALTLVAELETTTDQSIDLGDVTAYALNRLPPLYATTEQGASYQKQKATNELQELINQRVQEAINHLLGSEKDQGDREPLGKEGETQIVDQITSLLDSYVVRYEQE